MHLLFSLSWNVSPGFGSEKLGWFGVRGGWPPQQFCTNIRKFMQKRHSRSTPVGADHLPTSTVARLTVGANLKMLHELAFVSTKNSQMQHLQNANAVGVNGQQATDPNNPMLSAILQEETSSQKNIRVLETGKLAWPVGVVVLLLLFGKSMFPGNEFPIFRRLQTMCLREQPSRRPRGGLFELSFQLQSNFGTQLREECTMMTAKH